MCCVDVFRGLTVANASGVGVKVGLSPFEGEGGFGFLGESGGESGQDAGVLV